MNKNDLISVIILSYCNLQGIYTTLDSILCQTHTNIEIILSDDGSPGFESEKKKINEYINENNNGNVCNVIFNGLEVNGGTVKNINSALRLCNGTYIKILSSEDRLSNADVLKKYMTFLANQECLICFGKMRGVLPDGKYKYELLACESDYELLKSYSSEQIRNKLFARNFLPAPAWFAKKELFLEHGLFLEDTKIIEDYPYWCYLASKNVKFGFLDEITIDYKLSGVSSAGSYSELFMTDMLCIYEKHIFPNDSRFGVFQPLYNIIKRAGLNYYMTKARWGKLTRTERVMAYFKYALFYIYTWLLDEWNNLKNKRYEMKNR